MMQLPSTEISPVAIAADGAVVVVVPEFDPARAEAEMKAARLRVSLSGLWASEQDEESF